MKQQSPLKYLLFSILFLIGIGISYFGITNTGQLIYILPSIVFLIVAILSAIAFNVADQWEKAVILRLGKFKGLEGPGIFYINPLYERVVYWIDTRIITTSFTAEKDPHQGYCPGRRGGGSLLEGRQTRRGRRSRSRTIITAITWASQTALREVIGKSFLSDMLEGREKLDIELQKIIDLRTEEWGIHVSSVEIRDVIIPRELQDSMSMQAQAERERQARVILGDSERQVAQKFEEAARVYQHNPTALHLRAMNMLYEGLKEKATLVIVPATVLDTMTLGDTSGIVALTKSFEEQRAREEAEKKAKKEEKEQS